MTIPLDKLYNFLEDIVNQDIVIYRWYPHGSKLLKDLTMLRSYSFFQKCTNPLMICHDQEPLNYYLYNEDELLNFMSTIPDYATVIKPDSFSDIKTSLKEINKLKNITDNYVQETIFLFLNIYNNYILVHSEKNSSEINNYVNQNAIPVYYFSHALISRDWFRYAEIDPLIGRKNIQKDFLIYHRAWSGTREYRVKFFEMLLNANLSKNCMSKFNPLNEEQIHYLEYQYKNNVFIPQRKDIENYFSINTASSHCSADYIVNDYNQTRIEVVLETLFDDQRWHLTEKIFRPIACGQPFILAATPGSLEYLKSYGFKTFNEHIDESYDQILDPINRLNAIVQTMKNITNLPILEKNILFAKLQHIADYNRKWFFSEEFYKKIINEYHDNVVNGLETLKRCQSKQFLDRWQILKEKNIFHTVIAEYLTEQEHQTMLKLFESSFDNPAPVTVGLANF